MGVKTALSQGSSQSVPRYICTPPTQPHHHHHHHQVLTPIETQITKTSLPIPIPAAAMKPYKKCSLQKEKTQDNNLSGGEGNNNTTIPIPNVSLARAGAPSCRPKHRPPNQPPTHPKVLT